LALKLVEEARNRSSQQSSQPETTKNLDTEKHSHNAPKDTSDNNMITLMGNKKEALSTNPETAKQQLLQNQLRQFLPAAKAAVDV